MTDKIYPISTSTLLHTGAGELVGLVLTASVGNPLCTIYDNTTNSGTKIFEAYCGVNHPLIIFFDDRTAPRFGTGLYVALAVNLTATLWTRQL
jgi:hypothetical protein